MRLQAIAPVAFAIAGAIISGAPPALAQEGPSAACTAPAPLPAEFADWGKSDLTSAAAATDLSKASLAVGKGYTTELHPTREVAFLTQPEKPGGSVSHGGMFAIDVAQAGTYRVALGSGAWIDVLKDGKALVSTNHGMGPRCTGVRKMVEFALEPGRYVVQISANADEKLPIMVTRRP